MLNKKIIRKEISVLQFILLLTSKLMIGVGIGLVLASYYLYLQPLWMIIIILGLLVLMPTLYFLMKAEAKEEISLKNKLNK